MADTVSITRAEVRALTSSIIRHGGLTDEVIAELEAVDVRVVQLVRRTVKRRPPADPTFAALDREMRSNRSLCG